MFKSLIELNKRNSWVFINNFYALITLQVLVYIKHASCFDVGYARDKEDLELTTQYLTYFRGNLVT